MIGGKVAAWQERIPLAVDHHFFPPICDKSSASGKLLINPSN